MRLIAKLKDWQTLSLPVFLFILIFDKTKPLYSKQYYLSKSINSASIFKYCFLEIHIFPFCADNIPSS